MRRTYRIALAIVAAGLLAVPAAWAHVDPAGASESGAGQRIGLFDDAACTVAHPEGEPITDCQTMYVRATLVFTGLPGSSFEQGRWRIEANGVEIADITPPGNVPCIGDPALSQNDAALPGGRGNCLGAPDEFQSVCVAYTPNAADIGAMGIFFQALWGDAVPFDPDTGYTHRSDNDNPGASATASEFIGIEPCPVDECNQGCVPATGQCTPVPFSTVCTDTDGNECTIAGCDGLGSCDQNHVLPDSQSCTPANPADPQCATPGCDGAGNCDPLHIVQDNSTTCADTDGNECTVAGCDGLGVCDQNHILPDSQVCTPANPADPQCATPGCDGAGNCDPLHIVEDFSTVCTDTDGNVCTEAGCDGAGVCDQSHIEPDSKVCPDTDGNACTIAGCDGAGLCDQKHICDPDLCPITIGDFIWSDTNGNGQQEGGELGIPGCDVDLVDCAGGVVDSDTTDGAGMYSFQIKVNAVSCEFDDSYEIEVDPSCVPGYTPSPNDVGNDATDSDCVDNVIPCTNYTSTDLTRDCGYVPPPEEEAICRTPGFWGTHGGISDDLIDHAGGSIEVCGNTITNGVNYGSLDDALEAICVSVKGYGVRQLYRQLTAARLNCEVSLANDCGALIPFYSECDALCAANGAVNSSGLSLNDCIDAIDCFNNGGIYDPTDGGCKSGICNTDGSLCNQAEECEGGGDDGGDVGDCCVDNGTPGCDDPTCEDIVCNSGTVVGTSNCCEGGDGVGCNDAACEALVCGADEFCCSTAWDGLCDAAASDLCEVCSIIDPDPFCCDTEWDSICADEAALVPECGCDAGDAGPVSASTEDGSSDATPGVLVGLMGSGSTQEAESGGLVPECIKLDSCHDRELCPDPDAEPDVCYEPVGQQKDKFPMTPKECNAANKSNCAIVPVTDPKAGGCKDCDDNCDLGPNP